MRALGGIAVALMACGDNLEPTTEIVGRVFADTNGNGVFDEGESPLAAVVYVELDGDPSIGAYEPRTRTADDGTFTLSVDGPGTYDVRMVPPFGQRAGANVSARAAGPAPIVGGADAGEGDYGFMVSLAAKFGSYIFPTCGGALISDRHVITAAHCSVGEHPSNVAIIAGTLDAFGEPTLILDVASIRIHPSYNDSNVEGGYDVAVWTLVEPIDLVATGLSTVEMLTEDTLALAAPGTLATAIGWGTAERPTELLQQVHVPVATEAACGEAYPHVASFETQICAGALEGGIDSCQGDSGGPLLVRDPIREVWLHAGVTSWGEGCGVAGYPGVYARTSALAEWVMDVAKEPAISRLVTIDSGTYSATVDFATFSTVRAQTGPIAARWQATGSTLPEEIDANTPVSVSWSILSDDPSLTGFACRFEADVLDPALGQDVACGVGANELALSGFATGVFVTELSVSRPGEGPAFRRRTNIVAGSPARTDTYGALVTTDRVDPDYSQFAKYYIDYFEITGLSETCAFAIEVSSLDFVPYLALYDLDERSLTSGGGLISYGDFKEDGTARIIVVPEPGRRYLVGVSSYGDEDIGDYTVSLINDGTLAPY